MSTSIDQQFIEFIVKSLVGNPDAVKVERRIDEKGVLLELTVDGEDLGRVIGKRGATAQSLRTLLRALGTKNDARYNLKIIDVNGGPSGASRDDSRDDNRDENQTDEPNQDLTTSKPRKSKNEDMVEDEASAEEPEIEDEQPEEPAELELDGEPEEVATKEEDDNSDVISKTRRELADLDDLDL